MMKKIYIAALITVAGLGSQAQPAALPLKEWTSSSPLPFIFYLSGDGGFNSFSNGLCDIIHQSGYPVTALNSKSYFWAKKTPEGTAQAISAYLESQFTSRVNQQLVLVGYSFGSDVLPFIINILPVAMKKRLVSVVLVSPSTSTDFQVHWSDMFGGNTKRSMNVLQAINRMDVPRVTSFFGADEDDFPAAQIKLPHHDNHVLPGGHKYDGHVDDLARMIIASIR